MSMLVAIALGTVVLAAISLIPSLALGRGGPERNIPVGADPLYLLKLGLAAAVVATCIALLQLSRAADTVGEAVFAGFMIGLIPSAAAAGKAMRSGDVSGDLARATPLLCAMVLSSLSILFLR